MCPQPRTKRHDDIPQCLDTLGTPGKIQMWLFIKFGRGGIRTTLYQILHALCSQLTIWIGRIGGRLISFTLVESRKGRSCTYFTPIFSQLIEHIFKQRSFGQLSLYGRLQKHESAFLQEAVWLFFKKYFYVY